MFKPSKQKIRQFSQNAGISIEAATKLLEALYNSGLNQSRLETVRRKVEQYITANQMSQLINDMSDEVLAYIVRDMIVEQQQDIGLEDTQHTEIYASTNLIGSSGLFQFSEKKEKYKEGDMVSVQIMRTGERVHPTYWVITINENTLKQVKHNFDDNILQIDIVVDEDHDPTHKALAVYRELYFEWDDALYAKLELTPAWAEVLNKGYYLYFSPEIELNHTDAESWDYYPVVLKGGGFTNRPFFKGMEGILMASEWILHPKDQGDSPDHTSTLLFTRRTMHQFLLKLNELAQKDSITKEEKEALVAAFSEVQNEADARVVTKYNSVVAKFSETADEDPNTGEDTADKDDDADTDTGTDDAWADGEGDEDEDKDKDADDTSDGEGSHEDTDTDGDDADTGGDSTTISANDSVTMSMSEAQALRDQAKAYQKMKIEQRVQSMTFSETNKNSTILPKQVNDITSFVMSLNDSQQESFFGILEKFKDVSHLVGETWSKASAKEMHFNDIVDSEIAKGVSKKEALRKATKIMHQAQAEKEVN